MTNCVWQSACGRFRLTLYQPGDHTKFEMRPDMAAGFADAGRRLPDGARWTLYDKRRGSCLGIGGLEPSGAAASLGWFLSADLSAQQWLAAVEAVRNRMVWAKARGIKRVHVLVDAERPAGVRMMQRVGFKLTGQEDGHAVMTRELI